MRGEVAVQAADEVALGIVTRISARGDHHAEAGARVPACFLLVQPAFDGGQAQFRQVGLQAHQDGLGFRVAETHVVFQHLRIALR